MRRVVHLGAYGGVRASIVTPLVYEESNIRGTLSLLEAARANPVKRFLLTSSSTVYGREAEVPFREDAALGVPLSPYAATKRAAELLGLTYHHLHDVPVVCLRPFSVYGPRVRPIWLCACSPRRFLPAGHFPCSAMAAYAATTRTSATSAQDCSRP